MKVAIATISSEKIRGIENGFNRFYNTKIDVVFQKVDSGVSEQPFGYATFKGASNRVNEIRKTQLGCDYYVASEAGIEIFGNLFFNVQVVCIYDTKSQRYLYGKSHGWQIPSADISIIKERNLDTYLRNKGINSIEELLGPRFSRSEAIAQATELALASTRLL